MWEYTVGSSPTANAGCHARQVKAVLRKWSPEGGVQRFLAERNAAGCECWLVRCWAIAAAQMEPGRAESSAWQIDELQKFPTTGVPWLRLLRLLRMVNNGDV